MSEINDKLAYYRTLLRERLAIFLSELSAEIAADTLRALEEPGKLMSSAHLESEIVGFWPLLTLLTVQIVSPNIDIPQICTLAVAMECYICALDLLDDIEDEDQTYIVQLIGPARVLNISTVLFALSQRAVLSLSQLGVGAEKNLQFLNAFQKTTLLATNGQHQDILAEQNNTLDYTVEMCLEIAKNKSGSLMQLAFQLAAIYADVDEETYQQLSELGSFLGISNQLNNDGHDLSILLNFTDITHDNQSPKTSMYSRKSDLSRSKKTVPIVIADRSKMSDSIENKISSQEALHEGILVTWGLALLYRERARDCLQEIEKRYPIVPELHHLLGF